MQQCGAYKVFAFVCLLGFAVGPMEVIRLRQVNQKAPDEPSKGWSCIDILHIIRYLVMGWACLVILPTMLAVIPVSALKAILAGGVCYTSGVFFFVQQKIEFHLAIWHSFVLFASVCFYLSNLLVLV